MKSKTLNRFIATWLVAVMLVTCMPGALLKISAEELEGAEATVVYGYADVTSSLNVRKGPGTTYGYLVDKNNRAITLYPNQKVEILSKSGDWYQIKLSYNGKEYTGYVSAAYLNNYDGTYDEAYAAELIAAGFPESYIPALCYLHSKHPTWVFTPYITNLEWTEVVEKQSELGKSLIQNVWIPSWYSKAEGAYNPATDRYTVFDGSDWIAASDELIAFYADPRNFLSENGIFMFEKLSYNSANHTVEGVQNVLNGTFMEGTYDGVNTYASLFVEAGIASGVSPIMLAARVKQEQGTTGKSGLISGTYPGYEGYYNHFNFGAYGASVSAVIINGLKYASKTDESSLRPWDSIYKSIMGGSLLLGRDYINKGQDTLYLQRFNVTPTNTYNHQYMTNIMGAATEAGHQRAAYSNVDVPIEFSIPVFNNMTDEPVGRPTAYQNSNAYLSALTVDQGTLSPKFNYATKSYSVSVDATVSKITISGTTASTKSSVAGTGTKTLVAGNNEFDIVVTAEDGTVNAYRLTVVRESEQPSPTLTPTPIVTTTPTPTVTGSGAVSPTITSVPTVKPTNAPTKEPESISSSEYEVKSGYIIHVAPETTVDDFMKNLTIKGTVVKKVINSSGTEQKGSATVATGHMLETDGSSYLICVDGDVTGDGKVGALDLLRVNKNIVGMYDFTTTQKYAACVSGSTTPGARDLLRINKFIVGLLEEF